MKTKRSLKFAKSLRDLESAQTEQKLKAEII